MKKSLSLVSICVLGLLINISAAGVLQKTNNADISTEGLSTHKLEIKKMYDLHASVKPMNINITAYKDISTNGIEDENIQPLTCGSDTQVTSGEQDEAHPSVGSDYAGNPVILYDYEKDSTNHDICIKRSIDRGKTWTEDMTWIWNIKETCEMNPDISFMDNGIRAFGTHEVTHLAPYLYFHDYEDIDDPSTWKIHNFNLFPETTYVKDTAITTYGSDTIALCCVVDLTYHEYELEDTTLIHWNTDSGDGSWPGLFIINEDGAGNSNPISHLNADSGDKILVTFQIDEPGIDSDVYVACCPGDDMSFENWKITPVASGKSNAINPDIASSGKYSYLVLQDDTYGSQDILCYTSTSGIFWTKHVIAYSSDDETCPVITADGKNANCIFTKNGNLYESQTEDGGITWSDPKLINDIYGTVVEEFGCVDIKGAYATWTDNRDGNNDIYLEKVGGLPIINIEGIYGGFTVDAKISNFGNAPAVNVQWTIKLDGRLVTSKSKNGIINKLSVDETTLVESDFIFGLGRISIKVTAGYTTREADGIVLGSFILVY